MFKKTLVMTAPVLASAALVAGGLGAGTLSAWYVWSALGFYPSMPGAPVFVTGTPMFDRVEMGAGKPFVITSTGTGPYVSSARLNGGSLSRTWFTAAALHAGGSLSFGLSPSPSSWGSGTAAHPPSVSTVPLSAFGC